MRGAPYLYVGDDNGTLSVIAINTLSVQLFTTTYCLSADDLVRARADAYLCMSQTIGWRARLIIAISLQGLTPDCALVALAPQPLAEDGRVLLGARLGLCGQIGQADLCPLVDVPG